MIHRTVSEWWDNLPFVGQSESRRKRRTQKEEAVLQSSVANYEVMESAIDQGTAMVKEPEKSSDLSQSTLGGAS